MSRQQQLCVSEKALKKGAGLQGRWGHCRLEKCGGIAELRRLDRPVPLEPKLPLDFGRTAAVVFRRQTQTFFSPSSQGNCKPRCRPAAAHLPVKGKTRLFLPCDLPAYCHTRHQRRKKCCCCCCWKQKQIFGHHEANSSSAGDPGRGGFHHRRERVLQQPGGGGYLFRAVVDLRLLQLRAR